MSSEIGTEREKELRRLMAAGGQPTAGKWREIIAGFSKGHDKDDLLCSHIVLSKLIPNAMCADANNPELIDRFKGSNAPHSSQCRSPSSGEEFVRNLSNKNYGHYENITPAKR